ncbi:acyltransferase family protein [Stakelama tenebrarum]|uniref:Acyltransferase n=1 Tax=Stakelama tenebrarum TaxID=2711215 RepID=A0A6G6Y4N9_9SPHN|nr:acyltransferase [Sphingosinithalassobacter tenebrarum]QIG79536.1 acyltransferase [Sphingosinithalassobacter tenebrarum]
MGKLRSLFSLKPESPDLLHLDMLRVAACYFIVLVHFRINFLSFTDRPQRLFDIIEGFSVSVDLFFVVSGFVIAWVYRARLDTPGKYANFMRKRVARLIPLHWATLLFFVLVGLITSVTDFEPGKAVKYDWSCLVPNALLIQSWGVCGGPSFNTVSWSISAEMFLYFIYPLLFFVVTRTPLAYAAGLVALLAYLYLGGLEPFWVERTHELGVLRAVPGFALGVFLFHYRERLAVIPASSALMVAAMLLFLTGVFLEWHKGVLVLIAYSVALFGAAADMRGYVPRWVRLLAPAGRLTYSLYLLHPIVQTVFLNVIGRKLLGLEGVMLTAWTLVGFGVAGVLSILSLKLFEEPMRRWLAGSRSPRSPKADPRDERFSI